MGQGITSLFGLIDGYILVWHPWAMILIYASVTSWYISKKYAFIFKKNVGYGWDNLSDSIIWLLGKFLVAWVRFKSGFDSYIQGCSSFTLACFFLYLINNIQSLARSSHWTIIFQHTLREVNAWVDWLAKHGVYTQSLFLLFSFVLLAWEIFCRLMLQEFLIQGCNFLFCFAVFSHW